MDSHDRCACLIEAECFPERERIGNVGIEAFLRRNHDVTAVLYDRQEVAREAYYNWKRRTIGQSSSDNPRGRVEDWISAVHRLGERVGFALFIVGRGGVQVTRIGVMPSHRRRGLGRAMFQSIADQLPSLQSTRIWQLVTKEELDRSSPFYCRLRFSDGGSHLNGSTMLLEKTCSGNAGMMFAR